MFSCGAAAMTARYSSKHTAADVTTTCFPWFIFRSRLFRHLSSVERFLLLSCLIFMTHWSSFPSKHAQAAVVGWRVAVCTLCPSLETYWAIPASRCLQNLIQESCQYGKQSCLCPSFSYCYEIIDEEKPTHAGCRQKQLMLPATAHAWPFNYT